MELYASLERTRSANYIGLRISDFRILALLLFARSIPPTWRRVMTITPMTSLTVFENTYFTFFKIQKKTCHFTFFFEMTYQEVVTSRQKFSHRSVKMSTYTSLSDHRNSIPSSRSVVHSEPLLNVNVQGNFGLSIYF